MEQLSQEQLAHRIARARTDFPYFCEHFVRILTKDQGLQPFILNRAQRRLWDRVKALKAEGRPIRIVILKARQMGFSTWVQAYFFWKALTCPETGAMVLAHDEDATSELFGKIELMYDQLEFIAEDWYHGLEAIKDTAKKGRKKAWKSPLLTSITVQTAGNKKAGRSRTLRRVHISELAFWENADELMFGLLNTLGRGPDTEAFAESTANGVGNYYHRLWKRAKDGLNGWEPMFFAWHEEPSYKMEVDDPLKFAASLDKTERKIRKKWNLTLEQLNWRRQVISDECDGDEDKFRQEYPGDDDEAFLVTGTPYFGRRIVEHYNSSAKKPESAGRLDLTSGTPYFEHVDVDDDKQLLEAPWHIWSKPVRGRPYVIGADVAGGNGDDYSTAAILDLNSMEVVATFRGKLDPDEWARELKVMGNTYANALIAPEKIGEGRATVLKLQKELMYPRIFYHAFEDEWSGGVQSNWGWRTSVKTRPTMLAQAKELLRKREVKLYDQRFANELMSFVRIPGSSKIAAAQDGTNDDCVIALCIALASEVRSQGAFAGDMYEELSGYAD